MGEIDKFKKTPKQREAINLIKKGIKNFMLYGGSRSGKSFIILYIIIVRALLVQSRHLCVRLHFNHIKTSLWLDTLPKVVRLCFPELTDAIKESNTDYFIKIPCKDGGLSEIWFAGLDDKKRTEKVLGKEYSTIFFNESSQFSYHSINVARTRLAEKNKLKKYCLYDENPPEKSHWTYSLFILGKDPEDWADIDTTKYEYLIMNPEDNLENIDESYIEDILNQLPKDQRDRFRDGLFQDTAIGSIYHSFKRDINVKEFERVKELNEESKKIEFKFRPTNGMDFNVNPMTSVCCEIYDETIYVFDEIYLKNSNTYKMADETYIRLGNESVRIVPDSTGKANKTSSTKTDHKILRDKGFEVVKTHNPLKVDRYNTVNHLLANGRIIIHPRCKYLIKDLEQLTHDNIDKEKMLSHISDALGYVAWAYFPLKSIKKSSTRQL